MKLLEKFEQSIERIMEGASGSLFKQSIQPAQIGRKLERAMLDQQRVSVGSSIVPNVYTVKLHPKDFAQFADYREGLARQMEAWLAQVATDRNLSVVDRIRVSIAEDASAKRRQPAVAASISDGRVQPHPRDNRRPAQATSVYRVEPEANRRSASLRAIDGPNRGRTYIVPPGSTSVGRAPDNDIVLDSPYVSRWHAKIECTRTGVRVEDSTSTHGTKVNGEPVRIADLEAGDEIEFADQRLVLEVHAHDQSRNGHR